MMEDQKLLTFQRHSFLAGGSDMIGSIVAQKDDQYCDDGFMPLHQDAKCNINNRQHSIEAQFSDGATSISLSFISIMIRTTSTLEKYDSTVQ